METKIIWNFTCGHTATQSKDENGTFTKGDALNFGWAVPQLIDEACPECRKAEREAVGRRIGVARKDDQAVSVFKAQAALYKQQIRDAWNNSRLRVELEIMLENCEILWAKKIRQIEMNANCRIDTSPSPKDTFVARIDAALEKMDLKCQEARISCVRRCVSVSGTSMAARAVHDWRQAVLKMEKVKADYEKGLKHRLERSEGV